MPLRSGIHDACEVHEYGMDNLSRHGLDHSRGDYGVKVEDTGMDEAAGGVRREPTPDFTKVHP